VTYTIVSDEALTIESRRYNRYITAFAEAEK